MANLSAFYGLVRDYVNPTPPNAIIDRALRRAAREFFQRTGVFRKTIAFTTVEGQPGYTLDFPDDTQLLANIEAPSFRLMGTNTFLTAVSTSRKLQHYSQTGKPQYVEFLTDSEIKLFPTPNGVYGFECEVMLESTLNARTIDDEMFDQWGEVIAAGASRFLCMQKTKPWGDLEMTVMLKREFNREIIRAANQAGSGYANEETTVQGRGFL